MPLNVAGKPLSNGALAVGGGLIVALVDTFLPWYTTVFPTVYGLSSGGHDALGYWSGWLFFLAILVGIALFVARNFVPQAGIPALPFTDAMIYAGLGVVMILCALLWLVIGGGKSDLYAQIANLQGLSWGPSFGVFIGIIAAAAVGVGGYLMRAVPQPATKPSRPHTSNA
jgi:hypothetical protein